MCRPPRDPERDIRLVKEGFSWPAFFFSVIWALWSGLWLAAVGIFLAEIGLGAVLSLLGADDLTRLAISIGFSALLGVVGNDIKRWTLFRRGFLQMAVVAGRDRDSAEQRFWDQHPGVVADLVR
jgi:hypothetical protein